MKQNRFWAVLGAAFLLGACGGKVDPVPETPVLRTVSVAETVLVLPEGGTAVLPFSVQDKGVAVSRVKFFLPGGKEPAEFFVKEVKAGPEAGSYQAIVADAGLGEEYDREVHLAVVQQNPTNGTEFYVQSSAVRIQSFPFCMTYRSSSTSGL